MANMSENRNARGSKTDLTPGTEQWARKFAKRRLKRWVEKAWEDHGIEITGKLTVRRWWNECETVEQQMIQAGYTPQSFEEYIPKLKSICDAVEAGERSGVEAPMRREDRISSMAKASMPVIQTNTIGGRKSIRLLDQQPIRNGMIFRETWSVS